MATYNWNVDTNLTSLYAPLELAGSSSRLSENGGAVAVLVSVDECDGVVERLGFDDGQAWSKDLLPVCAESCWVSIRGHGWIGRKSHPLVAVHISGCLQDRRADPVALRVAFDFRVSTVEQDSTTLLLARGDETFDPLLCLRRDDRAAGRDEVYNRMAPRQSPGSFQIPPNGGARSMVLALTYRHPLRSRCRS